MNDTKQKQPLGCLKMGVNEKWAWPTPPPPVPESEKRHGLEKKNSQIISSQFLCEPEPNRWCACGPPSDVCREREEKKRLNYGASLGISVIEKRH